MSLDLSSYESIHSGLFVKIVIYDDAGPAETLLLSDYHRSIEISGDTYTGLGQLMAITESQADLRVSPFEVSITISGIPTTSVSTVLNSAIKGSTVTIKRAIFDPITGELLSITGNPAGRFTGIVNNYSINEDFPEFGKDSTSSITLICNSNISILERQISGRATNPTVQKALYPGDLSMDRVASLANANYNFGAPR